MLFAAALALLAAIGLSSYFPRAALAAWVFGLVNLPVWWVIRVGPQPSLTLALAGLVLLGLVGYAMYTPTTFKFGIGDLTVGAFFLVALAPVVVGAVSGPAAYGLLLWLIPFLLGRVAGSVIDSDWLNKLIAVVCCLVAAAAVIEFVFNWHPFATMGFPFQSGARESWAPIQIRDGFARSEWAFGHSIALGATLAAAIPILAAATFPVRYKVFGIGLLAAGIVVTFSRGSLISAIVGLALVIVVGGGIATVRLRRTVAWLTVIVVAAVARFVVPVFLRADDTTGSAGYRLDLVSLLPSLEFLGTSKAMQASPSGEVTYGGYASIDSQLIFTGLLYGWFPLALGVVALLIALGAMLAGRASAATLSVIAQIPTLLVVALITQYAMWFWFIAGIAVATQQVAQAGPKQEQVKLPRRDQLPMSGSRW